MWIIILFYFFAFASIEALASERLQKRSPINATLMNIELLQSLRPDIEFIDFSMKTQDCNGPCRPTKPLSPEKLARYKILARLQEIGYCKPEVINTWSCGICAEHESSVRNTTMPLVFSTFDKTVAGIMGVSHDLKSVFIVFQGVQNIVQWVRSAEGALDDFAIKDSAVSAAKGRLKVHHGFYTSWKGVFPLVDNELKKRIQAYPDYTLSLIGHSFGGGIVGIMAAEIAVGNLGPLYVPSKIEIMTLGASRIGNVAYAQAINNAGFKDVARIVHSTDIVPHIPFRRRHSEMMHYKGEVWLSTITQAWVTCDDRDSDNPGEANNCATTVPFYRLSTKTHISYWTRKDEVLCSADPWKRPIEVEFLPRYALIKY